MPPDDPLAEREAILPADLAGRRLIGYADTAVSGTMLDRVLSNVVPPPTIRLRVHLSKSTWGLVSRRCGVAIVDPFAARVHQERGGTVRPFVTGARFDLSLIASDGGPKIPYIERFAECLERVGASYMGGSGRRPLK